MKKVVVFSGSGISAESGISTFRDSGGLWEKHRIEDVATPGAWERNKELVLDFYNQRRKQVVMAGPNPAHDAIANLQEKFDVQVITQNVDDLHERAGSKKVLHLHGEIRKSRSSSHPHLVYDIRGNELNSGDLCEKGSQLRPHIVWFGEMVPNMEPATLITSRSDLFIVVGTSLNVYPAAGLINYTKRGIPKYLVDPYAAEFDSYSEYILIPEKASTGIPGLVEFLLNGKDPDKKYA